ncbi:ABC transporter substrate-binding protein [Variovorax sp. VNK109]|uniref:ABC transporter substrate-binding protein n=1 Tax=Variovorax sp. VNK109 TaxID=3400919 RepID=UPI003BFF5700
MFKRRQIIAAVTAIAATASVGSAWAQDTFKIGVNVERTGLASSFGLHMLIGAQIALDEINNAGGVNGSKLELVIEDNRSSPEQAVIAVRNLDAAGVVGMLGPIQTSQCRTAFPAANRIGLTSISPGSSAPGLTAQNRPWTFRISALDSVIVNEVVENLRKANPNAKTVAIAVDAKDAYSQFLAKTVAPPILEKHGFRILNKDALVEIPPETTDFSVHITKIRAMSPDVVLVGSAFEPGHGFLREANRQKLNVPMFAGQGYITSSIATAAGDIQLWGGQPFASDSQDAAVQKFAAEFKTRVEKQLPGQYTTPTYIDASGYESIHVIADALRASKATPKSDVKAVRTSLRDHLTQLKDFKGLGNTLSINNEGDAVKATIIYRTQSGKWARQ